MARALPLVTQPYEIVPVVLRLLASGPLDEEALAAGLADHSMDSGLRMKVVEVDSWLVGALGLVNRRGGIRELSDLGTQLVDLEGTTAFNCQLLRHVLDRSTERFSYLRSSFERLDSLRARGEKTIEARELNQLLTVVIANKASGPIIRRFFVGVGTLVPDAEDSSYEIREICADVAEGSPELIRLVTSANQLLESDTFSWEELIAHMNRIHGEDTMERHWETLRSLASITSTRSVEYVIRIDQP